MNILIVSHQFPPSVGGVERVSELLARSFAELGHAVQVVTRTPATPPALAGLAEARTLVTLPAPAWAATAPRERRGAGADRSVGAAPGAPSWPAYGVLRRPTARALMAAVRWCDVCVHSPIRLSAAWPLVLARRPWVMVHHRWLTRPDGRRGWQDHAQRLALGFGRAVAVSGAIARALPVPALVLPNPYDDDLFVPWPGAQRDRELIFVGRLVSEQGADVLVDALGRLRRDGLSPRLTMVGDGPERGRLQQLAGQHGVTAQIQFAGTRQGLDLVQLLSQHRLLVAPSRRQEPSGMVALEAIGCGCVVVGSAGGGLPEAIGPCGMTFPDGHSERLADALAELLRHPDRLAACRVHAPQHLQRHRRLAVAAAYLTVLGNAARRRGNPFEWARRATAETGVEGSALSAQRPTANPCPDPEEEGLGVGPLRRLGGE